MISKNRIGNVFLSSIYICIFFILIISITNIARASDTPDLIIQDITWTPTNPSLGDTVTFTAVIMNQGNASSSSSYIHFYLDGSTSPLTYKSFTAIDAGSTNTVSFTWNAQAGPHTFKAIVDKDNKITESDETNNEKTITFSATSLSDLVVQDITWTPTNPSIGETITFTATIKNQGSGSSSSSRVYFYLDGSTSHFTYKNFGGLYADATTTVSFTWTAQAGPHAFKAVADKDNTVTECDETNNEKTITFSATSLSDLVVQDITWTPTNPSIGETVTFTATIKNQGNGSSSSSRAYFYLDGSTNHLTYKNLGGLSADATAAISFTWTAQAGPHTFKAVVDKDNTVTECDETNNEKTITFSATSLSDLVVQDITWAPTNPSIGETVTFTTTIKNQGNGSSSSSRVYFYLDGSTSHFTYKNFGGLSADATTTVPFTWTAQAGPHTFKAVVDKDNAVTECDETNNEKTIAFSATSLSDFVVQNINWTPTSSSIGDTITFTTTIKNQGSGSSSNNYVHFYFDDSNTHYTAQSFTGITAGSTTTVSFTWKAQAGIHTLKAVVDKTNTVTESDESNNEKNITYSTVSLSDLIIQNITWTPKSCTIGDAIDFTTTIKNQGTGESSNGVIYFYFDGSTTPYTYQPFSGIATDSITTVSFTWDAQKGSHTLKAIVDRDNAIAEIDEKNNEKIATFSVVSLSDLIIQDIKWNPTKPSVGDTVAFVATIKNKGKGKSNNGNIYFYLDSSANYFHTSPFIEINSDGITKVSCNWVAQFGSHTIRAVISEGNIKTESDQTNNEKTITISIHDITAPKISLNTQINEHNKNNILEEGEKLDISYGAIDDTSGIDSIKLFVNNKLIDSQNKGGTYKKITDSLPMGEYTIKVIAVDKASNKAEENMHFNVERIGPSVYFGSTKTEVKEGENAIITLSAVNPIGNPPMNVQLILKPPSGVSIYETNWLKAGVGSYEGKFELEPGDVKGISIGMLVNQPGTHYVDSEIYYEVEGKRIVQHDKLQIRVIKTPEPQTGFEAILVLIGFISAIILKKRVS
jgi:subtilase family serine protease